jgi:hypothetical protein
MEARPASSPQEDALRVRDDVGFFQAVRAALTKHEPGDHKTDDELNLRSVRLCPARWHRMK